MSFDSEKVASILIETVNDIHHGDIDKVIMSGIFAPILPTKKGNFEITNIFSEMILKGYYIEAMFVIGTLNDYIVEKDLEFAIESFVTTFNRLGTLKDSDIISKFHNSEYEQLLKKMADLYRRFNIESISDIRNEHQSILLDLANYQTLNIFHNIFMISDPMFLSDILNMRMQNLAEGKLDKTKTVESFQIILQMARGVILSEEDWTIIATEFVNFILLKPLHENLFLDNFDIFKPITESVFKIFYRSGVDINQILTSIKVSVVESDKVEVQWSAIEALPEKVENVYSWMVKTVKGIERVYEEEEEEEGRSWVVG